MNKYPDMDEMIAKCKEMQQPDESIVFAFGVGRMMPLPWDSRKVKKGIKDGLEFIKNLNGFLGVTPMGIDKNLLLFDTLNNAKGGRNLLKNEDVFVGNVVPILVKTEYIKEATQ